jgi:hypothetical protein
MPLGYSFEIRHKKANFPSEATNLSPPGPVFLTPSPRIAGFLSSED